MSKQYLQPGEKTTLDEFIRQVRRQTRRSSSVYQFRPDCCQAIVVDYSREEIGSRDYLTVYENGKYDIDSGYFMLYKDEPGDEVAGRIAEIIAPGIQAGDITGTAEAPRY
jgi:hypothetical protein